jgi:class 3 adenylate cyclase
VSEGRKVAAILVADVVGYSRLASLDEEATLARLKSLRNDLIDPAIAARGGRVVKWMGDGVIVDFRSVVEAVRCALDLRDGLVERNAGMSHDRKIELCIGVHLGDVVEESDGDLMGDGVNIAARLASVCDPGAILLSEDAWRQVRDRLTLPFDDLGETSLKNIPRPMRTYALAGAGRAGVPSPPESARSAPTRVVPPLAAPPNRPAALADALLAIMQRLGQVAGVRTANPAAPLSDAEAEAGDSVGRGRAGLSRGDPFPQFVARRAWLETIAARDDAASFLGFYMVKGLLPRTRSSRSILWAASSSASAASTAAIRPRSPSANRPGSTTCHARPTASRSPASPRRKRR